MAQERDTDRVARLRSGSHPDDQPTSSPTRGGVHTNDSLPADAALPGRPHGDGAPRTSLRSGHSLPEDGPLRSRSDAGRSASPADPVRSRPERPLRSGQGLTPQTESVDSRPRSSSAGPHADNGPAEEPFTTDSTARPSTSAPSTKGVFAAGRPTPRRRSARSTAQGRAAGVSVNEDPPLVPRFDHVEPQKGPPWRIMVAVVALVAVLVGWMAVKPSDEDDAFTVTNNPLPEVEPDGPVRDDPQAEAEARTRTASLMRGFGQSRDAVFAVIAMMGPAQEAKAGGDDPVELAAAPAPPTPTTTIAPVEVTQPPPVPHVEPAPEVQPGNEVAAPAFEPPAPPGPSPEELAAQQAAAEQAAAEQATAEQAAAEQAAAEQAAAEAEAAAASSGGVWSPAPGSTWQIQLINGVDMDHPVDVYEISLHTTSSATIAELHNRGHSVVCYFSAGTIENWRPDAGDYPEWIKGNAVDGWPDERWIDIRAWDAAVGGLMNNIMVLAKEKGCDGVDADNMNAYTHNTGFGLTAADQLIFNRRVADTAHAHGLGIGLKNNLGQIGELVGHFDWSINESCYNYSECHLLEPFADAGKAIFAIMYGDISPLCGDAQNRGISLIAKDRLLGAWRTSC